MKPLAYVVGVGARTPVGLNALQTAMLLRAGAAGMAQAPFADADGDPVTMCVQPVVDARLTGWERGAALALPALDEAAGALRGRIDGSRVKFLMCIDERYGEAARRSPQADEAAAMVAAVSDRARQLFPNVEVNVTARGNASAALCLPKALKALASRTHEAILLGSVHSDYQPALLRQLSAEGRIFKTDNLDSFLPGEGAAFVVLMAGDSARRHGLLPSAALLAVASGVEKARPDNNHSAYEAKGLTSTVREAAAPLVEQARAAGWAFTDLTFEMQRVYEWQSMLVRTRALWTDPYVVESPAQRLGRLGAVSMPLGMVLAAVGWQSGAAPDPIAMVYAGSDGGARGALSLCEPSAAAR